MTPLILTAFSYEHSDSIVAPEDLYNATAKSQQVNYVSVMALTICILLVFYVSLIWIAWYMEHIKLFPMIHGKSFRPFKILTFGGEASSVTGRHLAVASFVVILTCIAVLTGVYWKVMGAIVSGVLAWLGGIII